MLESRKLRLAFPSLLIASLSYMVHNWFLQDDAFISFRYALNFSRGNGLVFNPGDRVEGYTNFLWTILAGFGFKLNLNPEMITYGLSLICFLIAFYLFSRISNFIFSDKKVILSASLALFFNFSFSSYFSGGLESPFQIVFSLLLFLLVLKNQRDKSLTNYILISVSFSLLALNRLDSLLWVGLFGLYLLYDLFISDRRSKKVPTILALALPFVLIIGAWTFWKYSYYGELLPNTFLLKVGAKPPLLKTLVRGVAYEGFFVTAYFLIPLTFLLFLYIRKKLAISSLRTNPLLIMLVVVLSLYNLYFLWIGGDFMEFRFQAPLLPFYILLIFKLVEKEKYTFILSLLFILSSLTYSILFRSAISGFESIPYLKHHIYSKSNDWKGIGEKLNSLFDGTDIRVAVSPAGAIPYYSDLYAIDMLGLNNKEVAKNGLKYLDTPGHYKICSIGYLNEEGANLIIGHPWMVRKERAKEVLQNLGLDAFKRILPGLREQDVTGKKLSVVEISINSEFNLICWYLTPHQLIDELIAKDLLSKTTVEF